MNNCRKFIINLSITTRDYIRIRQVLKLEDKIIVKTNSIAKVLVYCDKSLLNRNFLFESNIFDAYIYVIDIAFSTIFIRNNSSLSTTIYKSINLEYLIEFKKQDCY